MPPVAVDVTSTFQYIELSLEFYVSVCEFA